MNSKAYIKLTVSLLLVGLIIIAGIQITIDPLFQYHTPWFGMEPEITDERYQVAGMTKNFEYDNAILGSSMSANFRISDVNSLFGGETVKLTLSGSSFLDWSYILDIMKNNDKRPKNILVNIDPFVLEADSKKLRNELPMYLYNSSVLDDVEYYYNFEIIHRFLFEMIVNHSFDYDSVFAWDKSCVFDKETVLKKYERPNKTTEYPETKKYISNLNDNLSLFSEYLESMSNTKFVFFFSPFSMLYWDSEKQKNRIELQRQLFWKACDYLLSYKNVEVYLWTDDDMLQIMSDLNNYRDAAHYSGDISKSIIQRIKEEKGKLTKENYANEINKLFAFINCFDYNTLFI